ncbi:MAG TPA: glycosyltransferase family 2 protein [Chitinophagales bacterium]|nr:glycosyltransferase family 2 protein [Chitinophagales bacterium]
MYRERKIFIDVIIPAYNEQESIAKVIGDIDRNLIREVIVVNNNSSDLTEMNASTAGATVLNEMKQGYGAACLKGMEYIKSKSTPPDIVVFLDADYSDHPEEMQQLIEPILNEEADLVIGARALDKRERGSMTPQQVFGNWLATRLLLMIYKTKFTDLGPFRAVRWDKLLTLNMCDEDYGWTVEMQLKAAKQKLKCAEVPVSYRRRIGVSKISGTVNGTLKAGYKIITTIFKYV